MSKEEDDRARDFEERDAERALGFVESRAALAEKIYSQAINSLWLGNSGAALATLSFIGATWKNGEFPSLPHFPTGYRRVGLAVIIGVGSSYQLPNLDPLVAAPIAAPAGPPDRKPTPTR